MRRGRSGGRSGTRVAAAADPAVTRYELAPPVEVAAVGPPGTTAARLVRRATPWRYRADGVDLGDGWRAGDVAAWDVGDGPLGHGEAYLETDVDGGGAHPPTAYFRRAFRAWSVGEVRALYLRLMADDGAVVYLNGHEVARASMPAGPVTFATAAVPYEAGGRYVTIDLSASIGLLRSDNDLAVEVHQAAGERDDLVFDAELIAWSHHDHVAGTPGRRAAARSATARPRSRPR